MPYLCVFPTQPHSLYSPKWQNILFALAGITPDISIIQLFTFYQHEFYAPYDQTFPSKSEERLATGLALGSIVVMP